MDHTRIAITAMGAVTALGLSATEHAGRALAQQSGIGPVEFPDAAGYPCRAAAPVRGFQFDENALRFPKNARYYNAPTRYALAAAREALAHSGRDASRLDPDRCAIYTGAGQTGVKYEDFFACLDFAWRGREPDYRYIGGRASHLMDRYATVRTLSNLGIACLSTELGFRGANSNFVQTDTASFQALDAACASLADGRCDVALAGGYDSLLIPSLVLACHRAGLLSAAPPEEACRPFDRRRDGLVLGEGAAFFLLERAEDAAGRGAEVLGEIAGTGCAAEIGDTAFPEHDPATLARAVEQATGGEPVTLIVARGIATPEGDRREAAALATLPRCPVTALKGLTGYVGAATLAVELAIILSCARRGFLPPIARHCEPDPGCSLDLVTHTPRPLPPGSSVLLLSSAWGGQVSALLVRV